MEHLFSAINNIFNFVIPVSDFFWDFPTNFSWYASIPIPVSYTHLDVYKRQVRHLPDPMFFLLFSPFP